MDLYTQNETSSECFGAQTFAQQKGAGNGSMGTSNITCSNTSTILIPQRVRQRGEGHFIISFRGCNYDPILYELLDLQLGAKLSYAARRLIVAFL